MVRKSLLVPQVVLMSALALGACSSSDSDDNSSSPGADNTFNGTWVSGCLLIDPEFPEDGYEREVLTINGASASVEGTEYVDAACLMRIPDSDVFSVDFTLAFPGGTTTTPQGEARHLDVTPTTGFVNGTALTEEQMQLAADNGAFDPIFTLILIDNAVLFLGDDEGEGVGESADSRPTTLDPEGFTLQ